MAVTSFDEIHDGREGETSVRSSTQRVTTRRHLRIFRAVTNSNSDDDTVVKSYASCPKVGDLHPNDIGAWCQSVVARNEAFSKRVWIVTVLYSSQFEVSANPLADPADITWSTMQFTRPYVKDRSGNWMLNAAGLPFDPAWEGDDSRFVVTIQKNLAKIPTWVLTYRDAVNSAAVTIDGVDVGAGDAKIMAIQISNWQERNNVKYRVLSLTIALDDDGWKADVLNAGFVEKVLIGATPVWRDVLVPSDKTRTTEPWPLDADGAMIPNPSPSNAVGVSFNVYKSKDFSVLPLN